MNDFVARQTKLLEIEQRYDIDETERLYQAFDGKTLEKHGLCILNMRVTGIRSGLGGKSILDVEVGTGGQVALPSHKFRIGDIVSLVIQSKKTKSETEQSEKIECVVHRMDDYKIVLVTRGEELDEDFGTERYRLNRLVDDVNYSRMKKALEKLREFDGKETDLMLILQGLKEPSFDSVNDNFVFFNENLNGPQKEAVKHAVAARNICLVHGPAGTGKTTTVVEIIHQLLKCGLRLLVCTPSNIAVDNIIERIPLKKDTPMIRIGHPCRILPKVLNFSLDMQLRYSEGGQLIQDVRDEIDAALSRLTKVKSRTERRHIYSDLKALRKELRQREQNLVNELVSGARVVFSTLSGAGSKTLLNQQFDVVIIDEATQAVEAESWIAVLKGHKLILAGDPCQLPPTVKSPEASKKGLDVSIFDRFLKLKCGEKCKKLLTVQYRMHELIMKWSSDAMYDGKLIAFDAIKRHTLGDLDYVKMSDGLVDASISAIMDDTVLTCPLFMIDTAGCDFWESSPTDETPSNIFNQSKWNDGEAQLCLFHIEKLVHMFHVKPEDIAMITPYSAQASLMRKHLRERGLENVEVGTVDGLQGREKEVVVVSLVRSNEKNEVGFLADKRRLNVALTRAKRHLCLVCDSVTVSRDDFMKQMVDYFQENAELRYAYMYDGLLPKI